LLWILFIDLPGLLSPRPRFPPTYFSVSFLFPIHPSLIPSFPYIFSLHPHSGLINPSTHPRYPAHGSSSPPPASARAKRP
jgi:hypothetical protein